MVKMNTIYTKNCNVQKNSKIKKGSLIEYKLTRQNICLAKDFAVDFDNLIM